MEKKGFFPHINALRFVAILSTVIGHWAMDSGITQNALPLGQYGVDLFFTISGFLITLNLLEASSLHFIAPWRKLYYFFINRFLRIFPAYFFLLLVLFIIHLITHITVWEKGTGIYYFTYTSNFLFYYKGFAPVSYLNHTWTLAVEEQFYIIWPFFVLLIFPRKINYLIYAFILTGILTHLFHSSGFGLKYKEYVRLLPFANYHTIGTGALLAFLISRRRGVISRLNVILNPKYWIIAFCIAYYSRIAMTPDKILILFQETVLCIFTASLVYAGWKGFDGRLKNIFDNAFIQYIGLISYGIYLFETPISFLLLNTANKLHVSFPGDSVIKIIVFALCTFTAAHLSYRYFESRFLKWKKNYH